MNKTDKDERKEKPESLKDLEVAAGEAKGMEAGTSDVLGGGNVSMQDFHFRIQNGKAG